MAETINTQCMWIQNVWGRRKGFGRKAYTIKTTWKNEMQMGE